MDRTAEGTRYPDQPFYVDPDLVAAFRTLFGLESGVPPTFVTVAEFRTFPSVVADPNLGLDLTLVLHGDQRYEYERPLIEGETLTARTWIESIKQKGDSSFLTLATDLVDVNGKVVARARSTMIERGR